MVAGGTGRAGRHWSCRSEPVVPGPAGRNRRARRIRTVRSLIEAAFLDQPAVENPLDGLTTDQPGLLDGFIICAGNVFHVFQVYGAGRTSRRLRTGRLGTRGFIEELPVAAWPYRGLLLEGGFLRSGVLRVARRFGVQPVVVRRGWRRRGWRRRCRRRGCWRRGCWRRGWRVGGCSVGGCSVGRCWAWRCCGRRCLARLR